MRRIYKGSEITHSMYLPVKDVDNLSYLSITLHTHSDNDVIKSYPEDVTYRTEDGEFVFTLSSDDIVTLQEGIVWATADFREITEEFPDGYDFTKRYQLPYYIKWSEGAISPVVISEEDVKRVVEEMLQEYFTQEEISIIVEEIVRNILTEEEITRIIEETVTEEEIRRIIEERVSEEEIRSIIENIVNEILSEESIRTLVEEIVNKLLSEERITEIVTQVIEDYFSQEEIRVIIEETIAEIVTEEKLIEIIEKMISGGELRELIEQVVDEKISRLTFKTINGESIIGEGNIVIQSGGSEYDDTELRERIEDLENIDHSQFLTEHQHLKTINNQSLVGTGNITIQGGGSSYDDTEIRQLIEQLQTKVEALEEIDHSQFLTEHQTLKTINNQSLVGTGNISIPEADYDVLMSALNNL